MKIKNLKTIFLLDGFGAILSAFLLGVVLVNFQSFVGIPKTTLYLLAAIPCFFAVYDFYCYFKIEKNLGKFLNGIAIANLLYCCLSIALAFYHFEVITKLGWLYIVLEVVVVVLIAIYELRIAKKFRLKN